MATEQNDSEPTNQPLEMTEQVLALVFQKVKAFETNDQDSNLFPNGIESVDVEIELNTTRQTDFRLAVKIAGAKAGLGSQTAILSQDDETGISFNSDGHRTIAFLAMQDLQVSAKDVADRVTAVLDAIGRSVAEAATFPDEIRNKQPQTKPFHFIDIPLQEGGPINPPLPAAPHVLTKIADFTHFLTSKQGSDEEKADAVSWLFHLFGDVHQPLHCAEHISELHPAGDRGGNSFKLKGKAKNLHSAWDGSVNVFSPGKDEEELASDIRGRHSRDSLQKQLSLTDPEQWARASFKIAKEQAYSIQENPQNPPQLSQAYLKNMEKFGQQQAALAGYRLADRLKSIFS